MGHVMSFFVDIYVPSNIKINKASVHVRAYKKPKKDVMLVLSHLHSFGKIILFPDEYNRTHFLEKSTNFYANASVNSMLKCCFIFVFISCKDKGIFVFFATKLYFVVSYVKYGCYLKMYHMYRVFVVSFGER